MAGPGGAVSILFLCDFNAHGGTQTHVLSLLRRLDRRRFRPALAALTLEAGLAAKLRPLDVEVIDLALRGAARPATWAAAVRLAGRARSGRVDLLHGFLFQGNILTAAVSILSGVACLTSVRNLDLWKKRRHRVLSALAHRRAVRVIFNAESVRDRTVRRERIPPERAVVIPNGVEDPLGPGERTDRPPAAGARLTVVCVASLREKKGHADLLEAFCAVAPRFPGVRLLLVGEGPLRPKLEADIRARGLAGTVALAGYRPDPFGVPGGADLFVLPSLEEGMPNALLEAMALGLPCVATAAGGTGEALRDGREGFLVPPRSPADLAAAIERLLADQALRRRLGEAARRRYQEAFGVARMIEAYGRLYEEVARGALPQAQGAGALR
ncbi:MAG TPA: glycosyltransferase [Candidatus Polarisedimenticolia bacterium]|nr:glycosyltransferase [Candidatus Polarisedimenticolia bacterium]